MALPLEPKTPTQKSFNFIIFMGQLVGLLPSIKTQYNEENRDERITFLSFVTIYNLLHIIIQSITVILSLIYGFRTEWRFTHLVKTIFYSFNLWIAFEFFRLAQNWPKLMKAWNKLDVEMKSTYGYPKTISKRTKIFSLIAFIYGVFQVSFYIVYNHLVTKRKCESNHVKYEANVYLKALYPHIFMFLPYSLVVGIINQINYVFTYMRFVYSDLFASLISSYISKRFQQITQRLQSAADHQKKDPEFWREVREDYDKVCNLFRVTNYYVSNVIFVTFSANLILMLVYLRNSTVLEGYGKVYNILCFIVILIRMSIMLMYLGWVNDDSKEPSYVLNSVSSTQYNSEIQRFLLQISCDEIIFSGNRMFSMDKSLILNVGGIILTYELVLVQFADLKVLG